MLYTEAPILGLAHTTNFVEFCPDIENLSLDQFIFAKLFHCIHFNVFIFIVTLCTIKNAYDVSCNLRQVKLFFRFARKIIHWYTSVPICGYSTDFQFQVRIRHLNLVCMQVWAVSYCWGSMVQVPDFESNDARRYWSSEIFPWGGETVPKRHCFIFKQIPLFWSRGIEGFFFNLSQILNRI